MSDRLPSIFQYVHALRRSHDPVYQAFLIDENTSLPKEAQFAYHLLATTTVHDLYAHWTNETIYSASDFLRPAAAANPIAGDEHLAALLDSPKPSRVLLTNIARNKSASVATINRILLLASAFDLASWDACVAIAERPDLTHEHSAALLRLELPMVNAALARNPHVPQEHRVMAGLAA